MIAPVGVILMGGQASRMGGGDKGLLTIGSMSLLDHVLDRLRPQTDGIALNANGDPARLAHLGLPVLPDPVAGHAGPLAGILAGLDWAASLGTAAGAQDHPGGVTHIVTAAADTPFLPCDLVPQLWLAGGSAGFAIAASPSGPQPTFGLWPVTLRGPLRLALQDGLRKIDRFTAQYGAGSALFPDDAAFFNVNTPADLTAARSMI